MRAVARFALESSKGLLLANEKAMCTCRRYLFVIMRKRRRAERGSNTRKNGPARDFAIYIYVLPLGAALWWV